jgi:hypothetical protein
MSEVRELHDQAMAFAEKASVAKLSGNLEQANTLLRQAYRNEVEAAKLLEDISSPEPTRSILFRSAASLAIDCNALREAERLVAIGLSGNPPSYIAEELRDLFEKINFHRHLDLRGVVLESNELQMSIAGKAISPGIAPSEYFIIRIEDARKLMIRTVERLLGRPYREGGLLSRPIREYGLFVSVPRIASFAVSLRVSHPKQVLPGFEQEIQYVHSADIIDEIMSCLDSFNNAQEEQLRERIPQEAYYRNFIGLAKNLAPDGENVRQVGFTTFREGKEKRVSLTKPRDQIGLIRERREELAEAEGGLRSITGVLLYADARKSARQNIQLIDDTGQSHNVIVPEGMMSDIVRPLWEERVQVTGYYKGKSIRLEDINRAPK